MQNINELKARAYDLLVLIENAQRELQQVNQQIGQQLEVEKKDEKLHTDTDNS